MQEQEQSESNSTMNPLEKPPKNSAVLFLATVALIFAVISLVFQFFFWQLHKKNLETMVLKNRQMLENIQPKFLSIYTELGDQQKLINTLVARSQLEDKKNIVMQAREVEHLLTLAQYNLVFENNIDLASKLMTDADQKLAEINDAATTQIRKSLMNDLTALNAVPKADPIKLISQLAAMSDQVSMLSTLPVIPVDRQAQEIKRTHLSWKEKLMDTLRSLRGILTIRRLPENVKPLASPEEQLYIVENIRLQLTQAQWAVIHRSPDLYQESLAQAKKQLQNYYFRNPNGANLIAMIEDLQKINVRPNLPDLGNTINLLRTFIQNSEQSVTTPIKPSTVPQTSTTNPTPRALPS